MIFKRLHLCVAVAGLFLVAACDSSEERAEKHYQSGLELLEAGDVSRAMVEFRNVLSLNSSHKDARLTYARQARAMGNTSESYANFLRLAEQFPENMEARVALSEMAILHLNWEEAERHGAALIEANAQIEGRDVVEMALTFRKAVLDEDDAKVRELTREAEVLFADRPDDPILHRILIEGYSAENEIDKAIEITDRALEADPTNLLFYTVKSRLIGNLGDADALEAHLRATSAAFPDNDDVKHDLLRMLVSLNKVKDAEDILRSDIEAADDKVNAHVALITFLRELDGQEAALAEIDVALGLHENNKILEALKAGIVFDLGRRDEAVSIMQSAVDGAEPSDETDRLNVTLAKMLEANGNEVGARQLVEAVLDRDPGQVEALKMSAKWLTEADQASEAITILRQALDQEPEDAEAMTLMARAHERNGERQLAQDLLALAVEASGNAPAESMRFASLLVNQERFNSAEEVLINSLRRAPGNVRLLIMLGDIYVTTEDWTRAAQVEETLRAQDDSDATLAADDLKLRIVSLREGNEKGVEFLEELAEKPSVDLTAKIALVRARLAEDKHEEALALAEALVVEAPDSAEAQLVLGSTQFSMRDYPAAEKTFRGILKTTDDSVAAMQLVRSIGEQGRTEEAEAVVDEMLTRMPDNADLLWAKASFLERAVDIEGAIGIYERLYALNSDSLVTANNLASLLATYRQDEESLERAFAVGRRLRGTDVPPFQDTYGWILFRLGNAEEALPYLEDAANSLSNDPIVVYHLGKTYAELGRTEAAIAAFEASLALVSEDDKRAQFNDARAELKRLSAASE